MGSMRPEYTQRYGRVTKGSPAPSVGLGQFHRDRSSARLAYGAGAQMTLGRFAIRAEYERINASEGDPDLLSLGLTLSF